jgi:hypothetical protein
MPKLTLPIALMVLGTIKLPGEHDFTDAEAEHVQEQLTRLGHGASAPVAPEPTQLPIVTPNDVLETLATFLDRGEISSEEVAQRLGFVNEGSNLRIGMTVEETEEVEQVKEPEAPTQPAPPPQPAPAPKPESKPTATVIPPAVVKELVKAGFVITKPETIQAADDEALLAVKGMTPELLARVRQITE